MITQTESAHGIRTIRALRTVLVVANQPDDRVLETVADAGNYDVVLADQEGHT
jgi:hypothetical protein